MNGLWKATLAVGLFAAVALGDSLRFGNSPWPAVALFCLAGLLACAAACIDAAAESAKHEAELDKVTDSESIHLSLKLTSDAVKELESKVERLQKKDALNALG